MNREDFYRHASDKEERLLISRVLDIYEGARRCGYVKNGRFLNLKEQKTAVAVLDRLGAAYSLEGGYEEAERKILVCCCDEMYMDIFELPLKILDIKCRDGAKLSHRDYLGSVTGLGISRDMFGDIYTDENGAKIIVLDEISDYVKEQLTKIGRYGVSVSVCSVNEMKMPERKFKELSFTVSSLRTDSVISGCTGVSRSDAAALIKAEKVTVNWDNTVSVSAHVNGGDIISVRGFGRFLVETTGATTKKGRIFVTAKKYI